MDKVGPTFKNYFSVSLSNESLGRKWVRTLVRLSSDSARSKFSLESSQTELKKARKRTESSPKSSKVKFGLDRVCSFSFFLMYLCAKYEIIFKINKILS